MKLKLDENGNVVVQDGKPVYVHDDGKEVAFDAAQAVSKIASLGSEAKNHRLAAEKATADLKAFEGIEDPAAALKALQTVKNLDDKQLIDAGEVERVKADMTKLYTEKLDASASDLAEARKQLHNEVIGGSFARSKFIQDNVAVPVDMIQATFGHHFKMENGRLVVKDSHGNDIGSRTNIGEPAGFDEALEILISAYPYKDSILKASGSQGGGTGNGGNPAPVGLKRSEMSAIDKSNYVQAHGQEAYLKLEK